MTLILQEPCPTCQGTGVIYVEAWREWHSRNARGSDGPTEPEPDGPEESFCIDCEGTRKRLTEDGKAVSELIHQALNNRDNAIADAEYHMEEIRTRRARSQAREMDDLRRSAEQERWAREDLERRVMRKL